MRLKLIILAASVLIEFIYVQVSLKHKQTESRQQMNTQLSLFKTFYSRADIQLLLVDVCFW